MVRLGHMTAHYKAPGWFTRNVFNRTVSFLTRHGVSVLGSRVLAVKGRTSGEWRTVPVNLLGSTATGTWSRPAARASGSATCGPPARQAARRKGTEAFRGRELEEAEKAPVLRAYLKRWKMEVGCSSTASAPTRPTSSWPRSRPGTRPSRSSPPADARATRG